jgi:hypothetical protein
MTGSVGMEASVVEQVVGCESQVCVVSILMTGSSLILPCSLVETTDSIGY